MLFNKKYINFCRISFLPLIPLLVILFFYVSQAYIYNQMTQVASHNLPINKSYGYHQQSQVQSFPLKNQEWLSGANDLPTNKLMKKSKMKSIFIFVIVVFVFIQVYQVYHKHQIFNGFVDAEFGYLTTGELLTGFQSRIVEPKIKQAKSQNYTASICLILFANDEELAKSLEQGSKQLKYKNYQVVKGGEWPKQNGYSDYKQIINKKCSNFTFIMFASSPLKQRALEQIDKVLNANKAQLVYSLSGNRYEVLVFSKDVFENIQIKDVESKNKQLVESSLWLTQRESISLSLIQNSLRKMVRIDKQLVMQTTEYSFLWISKDSNSYYSWGKHPEATSF